MVTSPQRRALPVEVSHVNAIYLVFYVVLAGLTTLLFPCVGVYCYENVTWCSMFINLLLLILGYISMEMLLGVLCRVDSINALSCDIAYRGGFIFILC